MGFSLRNPFHVRWGVGEEGRWGVGEEGRWESSVLSRCVSSRPTETTVDSDSVDTFSRLSC